MTNESDQGRLADLLGFVTDMTTVIAAISFSLGLWLSLSAGILGWPLLLLLVPWFAKYLFVILSFAALGRPDVPVLSEELINPAQVRPLFILFLILSFGAAYWSATRVSEGAENAVLLSAIFLLPAMISVVVISDNPFRSLNPVNLARLIWSLRLDYVGVAIALGLLPAMLRGFTALHLPTPIVIFVLLYWLLIVFRFLGHGLYLNRAELGLQVINAPEIAEARTERVATTAHKACLDEVHLYASAGHHDRAYQTVCEHIHRQTDPAATEAWFLERLLAWENTRVGVRLARRAVSRLLAANDAATAWRWCERCLRVDTDFSVKSPDEAVALAIYAQQAGRKKLAYAVLQPFAQETGEEFLARDGMLLALKIVTEDPAMLAEATRLAETITRRMGDQLQPDDLALIRTVQEVNAAD
ncbi:MAG: hypothetical protein IH907_08715 [Proteobacteria bacterium]|nr:hypothetical protein [Pseudomonadota bacterium]